MGSKQLHELFRTFDEPKFKLWMKVQSVRVVRRLEWLGRKVGRQITLPETPPDIVFETIQHVLADKDGYSLAGPLSFDEFFRNCLNRTVDSICKRQGAQKRRFDRLDYIQINPSNVDELAWLGHSSDPSGDDPPAEHYRKAMAAMMAESDLRGAARRYGIRLIDYVLYDSTQQDIAKDIKAGTNSLPKFRARLLQDLSRPRKK